MQLINMGHMERVYESSNDEKGKKSMGGRGVVAD